MQCCNSAIQVYDLGLWFRSMIRVYYTVMSFRKEQEKTHWTDCLADTMLGAFLAFCASFCFRLLPNWIFTDDANVFFFSFFLRSTFYRPIRVNISPTRACRATWAGLTKTPQSDIISSSLWCVFTQTDLSEKGISWSFVWRTLLTSRQPLCSNGPLILLSCPLTAGTEATPHALSWQQWGNFILDVVKTEGPVSTLNAAWVQLKDNSILIES